MGRRVIHRYYVEDFSKLRDGEFFESYCGKTFIACDPPTPDECARIAEKTKNDPICKRCEKVHLRQIKVIKVPAELKKTEAGDE